MSMKGILKDELEIISPSRDEILKLRRIANDLIRKLKERGLRAYIVGSLEK